MMRNRGKITKDNGAWSVYYKTKEKKAKLDFSGVTSHNLPMAVKLAKWIIISHIHLPLSILSRRKLKDKLQWAYKR